MANYQRMVENYLAEYQPELKTELEGRGELVTYLEEQADAMQEAKERIIATLQERHPDSSPLQIEMEAERAMMEMFLTPI